MLPFRTTRAFPRNIFGEKVGGGIHPKPGESEMSRGPHVYARGHISRHCRKGATLRPLSHPLERWEERSGVVRPLQARSPPLQLPLTPRPRRNPRWQPTVEAPHQRHLFRPPINDVAYLTLNRLFRTLSDPDRPSALRSAPPVDTLAPSPSGWRRQKRWPNEVGPQY